MMAAFYIEGDFHDMLNLRFTEENCDKIHKAIGDRPAEIAKAPVTNKTHDTKISSEMISAEEASQYLEEGWPFKYRGCQFISKPNNPPKMDKNEKLQEQITELQDKMSRVEAVLGKITLQKLDEAIKECEAAFKKSEPAKVRPRAEIGSQYWFRDSDGKSNFNLDERDDIDNFRYNTGNYFLVDQDCEKYCEEENAKALARQRIRDYIMANGLSFEPDYKNPKQEKYSVCFNWQIDKWTVTGPATTGQLIGENFDFSESVHAEQFARDCEDDLNILIGRK